ncbi:MAG TPA: EAL domain-containing protein [Solirubrobacteraceae bacterium]|jgi:diguanylate cyclase (GGDEF)-like protein|nr:EAL domain-containing protein [Solirubrobacteraceae bacterium]
MTHHLPELVADPEPEDGQRVPVLAPVRLVDPEIARLRELVAAHNRLHALIAAGAPLPEVLRELVESVERYEPSVIPSVVLLDQATSTLHPGAGPSLPPDYLAAIDGVVIGPNVGACGSAAWSGTLTISEDISQDPKWAPIREFALSCGLGHCWSMPILTADGQVLGTFALYGAAPRRPQPEHLELMQDAARLAGIAIERDRTMRRLLEDARSDGLTGLPNRRAIFERLEAALAGVGPDSRISVLFVDLDALKALNDSLGHDRADEIIHEVGDRLRAAVREADFVGRFGGDEFVIIAEGVESRGEVAGLGQRLLDAISRPFDGVAGTMVTASVGIAVIDAPKVDAREAIRLADGAMYAAKRAGRGGYCFADATPEFRSGRRQAMARELRSAHIRGEMALVFQPVYELAGGEMVGVEALARWSSPRFGAVAPAEFIPIAEETGSIVALGAWALREGCETLADLGRQTGRALELSVNISALQLAMPGFARSVAKTLSHAEFPADRLTLEIAETALVRSDGAAVAALDELRELGVGIALDDFGTGQASLAWLKRHPVRGIKIDPSFSRALPADQVDAAIVAGVIAMAGALGATVTAEGVETDGQRDALVALRCQRAQGFLLAMPMKAEHLAAALAS